MEKKLFRKKPVIVEAIQWNGTTATHAAIDMFMGIFPKRSETTTGHATKLLIPTKEGVLEASVGDWIVKGHTELLGVHFWPVKPDYFEQNYEPVV